MTTGNGSCIVESDEILFRVQMPNSWRDHCRCGGMPSACSREIVAIDEGANPSGRYDVRIVGDSVSLECAYRPLPYPRFSTISTTRPRGNRELSNTGDSQRGRRRLGDAKPA